MVNLDSENYKILIRGYTGKMRENSPTRIYVVKIFPGVIPPDPRQQRVGAGEGRGG
jgi:hypothetical protein